MKTCPYCGSELETIFCSFCDLEVVPVENGQRGVKFTPQPLVTERAMNCTTKELLDFHTFDLLQLLKLLREERRKYFDLVRTFKVANAEEFREVEKETGDEYEVITRKVWVVENILRERIGYIPQKVTVQLLQTIAQRIQQDDKKLMFIKRG